MEHEVEQYISSEKKQSLEQELRELKEKKIPDLARRIDEARQMGDLSENAEYHAAREEMAWVQGRVKDIEHILNTSELFVSSHGQQTVSVGARVTVEIIGSSKTKEYMIVGAQEADPVAGKISNESPLGRAFLGRKKGDIVEVDVPAGKQRYRIALIA